MKLLVISGVLACMLYFLFGHSFSNYRSPRYVYLADEITEKTAHKLEEQKDLYLIGTGGGMIKDIQMMAMSFAFYRKIDLKTARELLVYSTNEYLSDINENEEIRPYLHEYPFTAKNVEICIWIRNPDGSDLSLEKIDYISAINGALSYYIPGPNKYSRQMICEETYEEALKLTGVSP
jgi:hypothetical protein